jgi:hypothetical protein
MLFHRFLHPHLYLVRTNDRGENLLSTSDNTAFFPDRIRPDWAAYLCHRSLSAYRSPVTNAMLRLSYAGVAEHSMHMEGKAVDVRFSRSDLQMVHRLATALQW